jgi:hypothetical protein
MRKVNYADGTPQGTSFWRRAVTAKEGWAWSVLVVVIGIGSLLIGARELENTQEALQQANNLSKKRYATDLITQWNKDTPEPKGRVHHSFPDLVTGAYGADGKPACLCSEWSESEWDTLYVEGRVGDVDRRQLREDIVWMLNYFEAVAVAYDRGLADSEIIEDSLKSLMVRWHECFGGFMLESFKRHRRNSWRALSRRVQAWHESEPGRKACVDRDQRLVEPNSNDRVGP